MLNHNTTNEIEAFKSEILEVGKRLANKGSDAGPALRKLQNRLFEMRVSDKYMNFLIFFLFNFIEDVYFNLSGDFPSDEKCAEIIDDIFRAIGRLLDKLGSKLGLNNPENYYPIYVEMVQCYLDGLTEIDAATKN